MHIINQVYQLQVLWLLLSRAARRCTLCKMHGKCYYSSARVRVQLWSCMGGSSFLVNLTVSSDNGSIFTFFLRMCHIAHYHVLLTLMQSKQLLPAALRDKALKRKHTCALAPVDPRLARQKNYGLNRAECSLECLNGFSSSTFCPHHLLSRG